MTPIRRLWSFAAALFLIGLVPGHGGASGGVVVLPHALAIADIDSSIRVETVIPSSVDAEFRLPSELTRAAVSARVNGRLTSSIGSVRDGVLVVSTTDLDLLRAAGVSSVRFEIVSADGLGLILDCDTKSDGSLVVRVH